MSTTTWFRAPDELLRELRMTRPEHIDVEVVAHRAQASVRYEPLTGCEAYLIGHQDHAIIVANDRSPVERQRFSIAHEIGHWMRDRGTVGFRCDQQKLMPQRRRDNPEHLANVYAADLLFPQSLFVPRAKDKPITLNTVRTLAEAFRTSLSATAIRLVQLGSFPAVVLFAGRDEIHWAVRGEDVPSGLRMRSRPGGTTVAYEVLRGAPSTGVSSVCADGWFEHDDADRYNVCEDTVRVGSSNVLTLLWWKDERQLIDFESDESD